MEQEYQQYPGEYYEEEYYEDNNSVGGLSTLGRVLIWSIFVLLLCIIIRFMPCLLWGEGACAGCNSGCNTEGMIGGFEATNSLPSFLRAGMSEGMYGGPQDYHAGCTPHYAYRNHHDYNLVGYKPPHLINMYPPSHNRGSI